MLQGCPGCAVTPGKNVAEVVHPTGSRATSVLGAPSPPPAAPPGKQLINILQRVNLKWSKHPNLCMQMNSDGRSKTKHRPATTEPSAQLVC